MMTDPPKSDDSPDPLCKICNKPLKEHTFEQQKECSKKILEND